MTLKLLDGCSVLEFAGLVDFVGVDASGQFGLRPRHEALVTALLPGLIACRFEDGRARYIACAGGSLLCKADSVEIVSRRFVVQEDEATLAGQLEQALGSERAARAAGRQSRAELERTLMRRLREWSEHAHEP